MRYLKPTLALLLAFVMNAAIVAQAGAADAKETAPKKPAKQKKIDLNSASEAELMELPGVGEVTAKKIIANRPYSSTKDLSKAGLSENAIDKISSHVTVKKSAEKKATEKKPSARAKPAPKSEKSAKAASKSTATRAEPKVASGKKVDLNTASEEELQALPGVGPAYAKKIIDNRPYSTVADLSKAGLPASAVDKFSSQVTVTSRATRAAPTAAKRAPASRSAGRVEAPTPEPIPTATPPITSPAPRAEPRSDKPEPMPSRAADRPAAAPAQPKSSSAAASAKVDLNKASQAELEALPGVGPVYAKKIIDNRPYKSTADLTKAGLPGSTMAKMSGLVTTGDDQVWLNTDSNVYHRAESPWYGKTKSGKFVSEQEAIDAGARESER